MNESFSCIRRSKYFSQGADVITHASCPCINIIDICFQEY